jgi:hypothetical protein
MSLHMLTCFPSKAAVAIASLFAAGNFHLAADPLAVGFSKHPLDSWPETWFHLIGGNLAKPGPTSSRRNSPADNPMGGDRN